MAQSKLNEAARKAVLLKKVFAGQPLDEADQHLLTRTLTEPQAADGDRLIPRMIVFFLGSIAFASVIGTVFLMYTSAQADKIHVPTGIVALGSAAVGGLAGLLSPNPHRPHRGNSDE
jgi:hypothetical protein